MGANRPETGGESSGDCLLGELSTIHTAYIGLFDRSLLYFSSNQVELALKNATSKSRTPVSMYQFDPI